MKNKKITFYLFFILFSFSAKAQQITILQENFTNYLGTAATLPNGWSCTSNADYTSSSYCGTSGPNAFKFGTSGSLTTPKFSNADSVQFWIKIGSSSDTTSKLLISQSIDSITWDTLNVIQPIATTPSTVEFPVDTAAHYLKFTYTKVTGNLSFDDFLLKGKAVVVPIVITIQPTVTDIGSNVATINWATNINGTSVVHYGLSPTLLINSATGTNGVNNHIVNLFGLSASTTYYLKAFSTAGNTDSSSVIHFTTANTNPFSKKIICYFNHPVDNSVSTGINAIYLNKTLDDTLIAYINRAKYSIDVAVYNFAENSTISSISDAINNAYARGVKIRWIYNGSSSNSGLANLNSNIPTLASPTGSGYNIMHNKFMIIDANTANENDPIVWTGSSNWDPEQFNSDANNIIIFQSQALAKAYTTEFNQMWGDSGMTPDLVNSKFGAFKSDITPHNFNIGGVHVEQYFSPEDSTNKHIIEAINSANTELYFGVYTFTDSPDADSIVKKINEGIYVSGIMDQYSQAFSAYATLNPIMGNSLKIYAQTNSIYHNKFMIVDECDTNSDPLTLTGSHNWTISANTKNDENTVIIHDAKIANIYYQAFSKDFSDLGGSLSPQCIPNSVEEISDKKENLLLYPNPESNELTIQLNEASEKYFFEIYNSLGQKLMNGTFFGNTQKINISNLTNGIYILVLSNNKKQYSQKFIKE